MDYKKDIREKFTDVLYNALNRIKSSNIKYSKVGLFGSFARGSMNLASDIDIVLFYKEKPELYDVSILRCDLDEIGCDLVILPIEAFYNPSSRLEENIKKDFMEVSLWRELLDIMR